HRQCVTCHAMAFRKANKAEICQQCHTSAKPESAADLLSYPRLKGQRPLVAEFSHARHVDKLARMDSVTGFRADCLHCHKLGAGDRDVGLPKHAECAGCHSRPDIRPHLTSSSTAADCRGCHAPEKLENPAAPAQAVRTSWTKIEFSH